MLVTPKWTSEQRLIGTWSPGYALFSNPYEAGAFEVDVARFARLLRGELKTLPERLSTKPSVRYIKHLHKRGLAGEPIAVDIETCAERSGEEFQYTGKNPTRARLKTIGLGTCDEACSHWCWHDLRGPIVIAIKRLLRDARVVKILHNGDWFDIRVLARYGIKVQNYEDTRDARRALSSISRLRLSYLGGLYTDYPAWKEDESDDSKGLVFTKSRHQLKVYNAHDCVVTARVWRGITAEKDWGTERVQRLYAHQKELSRIAAKMHTNGFFVNRETRRALAADLKAEYRKKEKLLLRSVGVKGFRCQPNHLRALIFKRHAVGNYAHLARFNLPDPVDPAMYTDPKVMDGISVDETTLTLLLIDPEVPEELKTLVGLYWDAQEVWKRRSVFVVSRLVREAIGKDGRLRAGWNSCGTDTGRFSCSEPNLMNIEKGIRTMYEAEPGNILVGADYSQLELRVMAAVAQDPALQAALDTGDVYSVDARNWFNLPPETNVKEENPKARKAAKIIHLGSQYAAGEKTVYQQALKQDRNIQYSLVKALCAGFKKTYAGTVSYWFDEMGRVGSTGYSESRITHRRRVYPEAPMITETANYPVQSTAADIKNLALIALDARLSREVPDARILVDLHDAIYLEVAEDKAEQVKRILVECMEVPHVIEGKEYVFRVEAKTAHRWSDAG